MKIIFQEQREYAVGEWTATERKFFRITTVGRYSQRAAVLVVDTEIRSGDGADDKEDVLPPIANIAKDTELAEQGLGLRRLVSVNSFGVACRIALETHDEILRVCTLLAEDKCPNRPLKLRRVS